MSEETYKRCDLCGRRDMDLPDGVKRVAVSVCQGLLPEKGANGEEPCVSCSPFGGRWDRKHGDIIDACAKCYERLEKFVFDRGLMTEYRAATLSAAAKAKHDGAARAVSNT